jgi:hypothetical protein
MKKLPACLTIVGLLLSVTAWAGWGKPLSQNNYLSRQNGTPPSICCSADGKTIYILTNCVFNSSLPASVSGAQVIYKSTDGGETWSEQVFNPSSSPAK